MISQSLVKEFQLLLGQEQVFLEETDRATYTYDAAVLESVMPAIVLRPGTPEQLGRVTRLCHENSLPLTVRGAGTNLSGGSIPGRGGAVVLTTALNTWNCGGTLSGEHGIGTAKARFLEKEFGQGSILYSKRLKAAVDPHNILNPGKIIGE